MTETVDLKALRAAVKQAEDLGELLELQTVLRSALITLVERLLSDSAATATMKQLTRWARTLKALRLEEREDGRE